MKLVQRIPIKGVVYKVYIGQIPHGTQGLCYKTEKEIILGDHLSKHEIISTLAHEIGHALIHECYIDQTLDKTQEEVFCEIISTIVVHYSDFFEQLKKKLKS